MTTLTDHVFYTGMRLVSIFITAFLGLSAMALDYEGHITKIASSTRLTESTNQINYKLIGSTQLISTYIGKLNSGDFLSIEGTKDAAKKTILVKSINYIGLETLIGTWYSEDGACYIFHSYTDFSTSRVVNGKCLSPRQSNFTYLINPSSYSWVMLISGQYGSYVGDLLINNSKSIDIALYDSETGDIVRLLNLRK